MNEGEDDDIRLLRAAPGLLSEAQKLLAKNVWKPATDDGGPRRVRRAVKQRNVDRIIAMLEPFQEDPQLLDAQLKHLIPPLVEAFLEYLQIHEERPLKQGSVTLSSALSQILNTLCKIRGQKIVKGFLNNEPQYLELVLTALEERTRTAQESESSSRWEETYILLLWLSHLMLAPFDLSTISSKTPPLDRVKETGIVPPAALPGIAIRVIPLSARYLDSATKERDAASALLVRLCLRPDMQKAGLLDSVIAWVLDFFKTLSDAASEIHRSLGRLSFLSGLVASANNQELSIFASSIYKSCYQIISPESASYIKTSAVARKLLIKTLRNIVVHCLQAGNPFLDTTAVLEDVIDLLLQSVADGDTPVRMATSKALSVICMKLEQPFAEEVVEAVLGCLNEDVLWEGHKRNLSAVNSLRWHGLVLTLAHLLYRKAISSSQLPDILNALLLALTFEQRSTTGSSVGSNVRDAACFGIWAFSRRYRTEELLSIQTTSIRAATTHDQSLSIPQVLAIELLGAATLDPAGNIRRGSSAALQELIGRHPNTVLEGIPLVQTVDFHAVGLRDRAICDVATKASQLGQIYWDALFDRLLGWRGVAAVDSASRASTARAIGLLSCLQGSEKVDWMLSSLLSRLEELSPREVEERHGLMLSVAALIMQCAQSLLDSSDRKAGDVSMHNQKRLEKAWGLLERLHFKEADFTSTTLRPELTAIATCTYITATTTLGLAISEQSTDAPSSTSLAEARRLLELCFKRDDDSVLDLIPQASKQVLLSMQEKERTDVVQAWLDSYLHASSHLTARTAGWLMALGAAYPALPPNHAQQATIVSELTRAITPAFEINVRVVALRSLQWTFHIAQDERRTLDAETRTKITTALETSLNDYTINERGDVGSLLRLEALNAVEESWRLDMGCITDDVHAAVVRLSVEKLDKVRARATRFLEVSGDSKGAAITSTSGISSFAYFQHKLSTLTSPTASELVKLALIQGYSTSAGMGSESVVRAARLALVEVLDSLPTYPDTAAGEPRYSLLDFGNAYIHLLRIHLTTDRVLLPLLETLAFLFDARVLQRLHTSSSDGSSSGGQMAFKWRTLLSLVQKAHFKSTNFQKLHLALDAYRGLAQVDAVRREVLRKLASMLAFIYPTIRVAAAETLFMATGDAALKEIDLGGSTADLRPVVEEMVGRWGS